MTFGELLKHKRQQAKMSRAELSRRANIPIRTLEEWESKTRSPISNSFLKLLQVIDFEISELKNLSEK